MWQCFLVALVTETQLLLLNISFSSGDISKLIHIKTLYTKALNIFAMCGLGAISKVLICCFSMCSAENIWWLNFVIIDLLDNYSCSVSITNNCSVDTILWLSPLNIWLVLQYRSILFTAAGSNGGGDHLTAAVVRRYCCYWYGRDCFLSLWACFKYADL